MEGGRFARSWGDILLFGRLPFTLLLQPMVRHESASVGAQLAVLELGDLASKKEREKRRWA